MTLALVAAAKSTSIATASSLPYTTIALFCVNYVSQ